MSWKDLIRISLTNLSRRRLRTLLTVIGVMIGTTSIVVMISLGLGLENSLYKGFEKYGGINTITVTSESGAQSAKNKTGKFLDDNVIKKISDIPHVMSASPVYEMDVILMKNDYTAWAQLTAMEPDALKEYHFELVSPGHLPETGAEELELLYGNGIITNFINTKNNTSYYETGNLPDIDMMKDTIFLVLDMVNYEKHQLESNSNNSEKTTGFIKHPVRACGVLKGGPEDFRYGMFNVYCDIDKLKYSLQREFSGRVIPGQPANKNGKPYSSFYYTSVLVKTEEISQVQEVAAVIRSMGYNASTNIDQLESSKREIAMIEAALGGIGAISLLVAAIGIANTMFMSIFERTKEIGVFKVLGCSMRSIRRMFLLEAAGIGFFGGILGILLSYCLSCILNVVTEHGAVLEIEGDISFIPPWLTFSALIFATIIGMLSGLMPALRAMNLSPLDAIRTE